MSSLSMVEAKLPPGFRFHPKDEELICDYLMKKVMITSSNDQPPLLMEVDLNNCEPWDIPQTTSVGGKDRYFYSRRDKKYATGLRTNRATISGYWKATGKDRAISRKGSLVGMRKTLVFYQGRAPKGMKTEWVMHEFRLEGPLASPQLSSFKGDWVLCRVFHKINKELHRNQTILGNNDQNHYNNNTILRSSLYLSPLMEPYITFDQQTNFIGDQYEQVPCLSSFNLEHIIEPNFGDNYIPDNIGTYNSSMSSSSNCDNNVSEVVLNHLSKMETNKLVTKESPSFGEGSSESFLSEDILPTMWVNQY